MVKAILLLYNTQTSNHNKNYCASILFLMANVSFLVPHNSIPTKTDLGSFNHKLSNSSQASSSIFSNLRTTPKHISQIMEATACSQIAQPWEPPVENHKPTSLCPPQVSRQQLLQSSISLNQFLIWMIEFVNPHFVKYKFP